MKETAKQATSVGIEIMTAYYSDPGGTDFAGERFKANKNLNGTSDYLAAAVGLRTVAAMAITELSRQAGITELELLQRFALEVQGG